METTKVLPCNCKSKFQDERYGSGQRLHNLTARPKIKGQAASKEQVTARCTVCKHEQKIMI